MGRIWNGGSTHWSQRQVLSNWDATKRTSKAPDSGPNRLAFRILIIAFKSTHLV